VLVFGNSFNIAISLLDIFSLLELRPFSGVTIIQLLTMSMSFHCRLQASPHLTPVSFRS
jgi:hypothetical protein